jgi:hypothetical protein
VSALSSDTLDMIWTNKDGGRARKPFGVLRRCSGCGRTLSFDYRQTEQVKTHHCSLCNSTQNWTLLSHPSTT